MFMGLWFTVYGLQVYGFQFPVYGLSQVCQKCIINNALFVLIFVRTYFHALRLRKSQKFSRRFIFTQLPRNFKNSVLILALFRTNRGSARKGAKKGNQVIHSIIFKMDSFFLFSFYISFFPQELGKVSLPKKSHSSFFVSFLVHPF